MEYYSVIKMNTLLIDAVMWINLENITLSERRQVQRATYCMIPSVGHAHHSTPIETDRGSGKQGVTANR